MKRRTTKIAAGLAAIVALALGGAAIANATQGGGGKLTQGEAAKASAASLRATGGGAAKAPEAEGEAEAIPATRIARSLALAALPSMFLMAASSQGREDQADGCQDQDRPPERGGTPSARPGGARPDASVQPQRMGTGR